ncbi:hexose kinase [Lysinibacter sp. HNR]|uniref:1-phosphofructokinase family hexose kinase n=1 Tax=Lysinibacter sp. HNR TaxID=3031408 RepID=UPI002434B57F|nr:hexose kinase [Lysinibacter sp. HNR]WGD38030.1 hexose kinase [Lysinibacter sp. HNR]
MILTLTPNPALDLTYSIEQFASGTSIRTDTARTRAGGKGVNVSRVLNTQNLETLAIVPLGGLTGQEYADDLTKSALPHVTVEVSSATRRSIAIVERTAQDTTLLNERGAGYTEQEWQTVMKTTLHHLTHDASCLVISGSLPPGTPDSLLATLLSATKRLGIPSIVDVSGPALLTAATLGATVLKPNRDELTEATGLTDPVEGALSLIAAGAQAAVVSLGSAGMICLTAGNATAWHSRINEQITGNPTGAGDAAVAALARHLSATHRMFPSSPIIWENTLRTATAWSASAVLMPLAGELSPRHTSLAERVSISTFAVTGPFTS